MSRYQAISTTGRETILIKDDKVVGLVRVQLIDNSFDTAYVSMEDAPTRALVKDHVKVKFWSEHRPDEVWKFSKFRFSIMSGLYYGDHNAYEEDAANFALLEYCRIVDKFNFDWGWCPESFATVEGYGAALKAADDGTEDVPGSRDGYGNLIQP